MPVWKDAMKLAEDLFKITEEFPRKEDYGLTSQLRRSALSISANISEAYGRNHSLDKINFYYYSRGSVTETQNHIEYGKRVGYIKAKTAAELDSALNKIYNDINKIILSLR